MVDLLMGLGLALPAGLNAYIPLLALGLAARFTNLVSLSPTYDFLASDAGLIVLALLLAIEVVADKVPLVDHANDLVQTFIRPAAGALLMLSSTGAVDQINPTLAVILGIVAAGSVHAAKATARPVVTASTGGIGNPVVSVIEDIVAVISSAVAILFPLLVLVLLPFLVALFVVIFRRWRRRRTGWAPR